MDLGDADTPTSITYNALDHIGKMYLVSCSLNKANDKEVKRKRIETAINTFNSTS